MPSGSSATVESQLVSGEDVTNHGQNVHASGCLAEKCNICRAAIGHIAGFYAFALQSLIKCRECRDALLHSEKDPCSDRSLLQFKDYYPDDDDKGLTVPSGSLCRLLFVSEKVLRQNCSNLASINVDQKLLVSVLSYINISIIFPSLSDHALETADGINNHFFTLVHLICRKYLHLRIKKILKDISFKRNIGNSIHRTRIFKNV